MCTLLTASDADGSDRFGDAVALDDDILVVGATSVDDGQDSSVGAVYFIEYSGGVIWTEEQKVLGSEAFANLGRAVEVIGESALAGEPALASSGRVILFDRNEGGVGNWGSVDEVMAPTPQVGDLFGAAIDLDGPDAAIGAHGTNSFTGAAYIFEDLVPSAPFFSDGFESGDTSAWSLP